MAETPVGETPAAPKNEPATPVVPVVDKTDENAVEALRKELEQAKMRANQLENEKKARDEADEATRTKKLEEDQEYKTLLEQERAKREALEAEVEQKAQETELSQAKSDVLKDYSDEVKEQAAELGIDLTTADDSAVTAFKDKLDKINTRLVSNGSVKPNNPRAPDNNPKLSGDELKLALQDDKGFHDVVTKNYPGIAAMTGKR